MTQNSTNEPQKSNQDNAATPASALDKPGMGSGPLSAIMVNEHASPGHPLFTASVVKRRNIKPFVVLSVLGVVAIGLGVGGAALIAPSSSKVASQSQASAAATQPVTDSLSDVTASLNKASSAIDRSEKDSLATDDSMNDSAHQIAVPTE